MSQANVKRSPISWYRRSGVVWIAMLLGILLFPLLLFACLVTLTGDVYTGKADEKGRPERWSGLLRMLPVLILIVEVGFMLAMVNGAFGA